MTQAILTPITTSEALEALCQRLSQDRFLTVDTEFMRERTYYPQLCLVQIAGEHEAALIDALVPDLDWTPFWELMKNPSILKVFHAPRQDIEIFLHVGNTLPTPLFDTQLAATACGFADQTSYARLAEAFTGQVINKEEQFTDWTVRPLRPAQLAYALQDVTILREVYKSLEARLEVNGRLSWLATDMAAQTRPDYYRVDPAAAWEKLRLRSNKPSAWAALKALAAWRELEAMRVNRPRQMILKDDVLTQIALTVPTTLEALNRTRGLPKNLTEGTRAEAIIALMLKAKDAGREAIPSRADSPVLTQAEEDALDLLKMALRIVARQENVAPRLIADSEDLTDFILGKPDPALRQDWRWDVFGRHAEKILLGKAAIGLKGIIEVL